MGKEILIGEVVSSLRDRLCIAKIYKREGVNKVPFEEEDGAQIYWKQEGSSQPTECFGYPPEENWS